MGLWWTTLVIMAIARLNGEVIAESTDTVVVEGHRYFPPQSVRVELLRPTATRDDRHYYSVITHGKPTPDCACCPAGTAIPDPRIAKHIEFLGPVEIEV
jgi:uncharacterized protein (DUF427 family)